MDLLRDGVANGSVIKTVRITKMTVDGITDNYPIYQIRLDNLYYNDQNDRISTWISQYKSEHGTEYIDKTNLEEYNNIIEGFIEKSNPDKLNQTLMNIELLGQQQYGVVLNDGRIIDGNRRYTCLRKLARKDDRFNYFEAVILDKNYENNAKQIKMLELQKQIGEEARVDYDPIDKLVGIYRDLKENELLTLEEYRRSTNMKTIKNVEDQLELATLLVEFLDAIHAPKQYYIARDLNLNGPLVELQGVLKLITDEDKKEQVKYIVFNNLLTQPDSDMTRYIRKIKGIAKSTYLDEFIEKELGIAEDTLDSLPEEGKVTADTIAELHANEDVKEELNRTMEIVSNKANATEVRNKPTQMVKKAIDSLESIDIRIIELLNEEQRLDLEENISKLDEIFSRLKEEIDV